MLIPPNISNMQIPSEGYSHAMGVVFNGDNPIGPEIGVHRGASFSSTGTKASLQACDSKQSASYRNTALKHQNGTFNEEDTIATKLETSSISS
jgi:hypothetical protein